jgi:hypothetical protein
MFFVRIVVAEVFANASFRGTSKRELRKAHTRVLEFLLGVSNGLAIGFLLVNVGVCLTISLLDKLQYPNGAMVDGGLVKVYWMQWFFTTPAGKFWRGRAHVQRRKRNEIPKR